MLKFLHQSLSLKLTYLQVADFLGELLDEMVWSDMVRDLTGRLSHLGIEHAH